MFAMIVADRTDCEKESVHFIPTQFVILPKVRDPAKLSWRMRAKLTP
jgi:hypothetical protein